VKFLKFLLSARGLAAIATLLLILFLVRPGLYKFRNRISASIGGALGRRVTIDNVHFHLLPRPGFDLQGLVIYDDPEFSPEPMIRADEVFAAIRFRSLFRGRLEIATLSATEPSINLVRNDQGRWNLASLLQRNAQIPAAPTQKLASASRPVFPYLEASSARINFKLGQTKKSYALMDADVALWQDSENSWAARIKAEPVRTDFHLTDTGLIQINALWQRAVNLRETPLNITVRWQNGQLGQITQLLTGKDRGWRGAVDFSAKLSGTPEALQIESQTAVEDFRRYDILDTESVRLATTCSGQYNAVANTLASFLCKSPVNGGVLRVRGTAALGAQPPAYDLTFVAEKIPLAPTVRLLRQLKKQIPSDLTADGSLSAEFRAKRSAPEDSGATGGLVQHARRRPGMDPRLSTARHSPETQWTGSGAATNVRLSSNGGTDEFALGTIPLALTSRSVLAQSKDAEPPGTYLRIGPVALTINDSAPVSAGGWISSSGYLFSLRGDAELRDLFRLERVLGLPVARPAAEGSAKLDVSIYGPWQGFALPSTSGTAQLRNVHAEMYGLNAPIEIASAAISLTPDLVAMQKISARVGNTHWSGGVTALRHCVAAGVSSGAMREPAALPVPGAVPNCVFRFDLAADQLSVGDIAEWLTRHPAKRPWYRILNRDSSNSNSNDRLDLSPLLAIQARGALHVGRFELKNLLTTQVATEVEVDRGKITLGDLRAQLLQGSHKGNWVLDVSSRDAAADEAETADAAASSSPRLHFHGSGTLQGISLEQVGWLMNDAWITGTADGNFDVNGTGSNFRELPRHSDGTLHFTMRDGSLPHIEIPGAPAPLPIYRFSGDIHLRKGLWELSDGRMESHDGFYQVSGKAAPGGIVDFVLTRGDDQSWALGGTLTNPEITPLARTQAEQTETKATDAKP
jgi:uncharacterized protein involved in outer membrane biogenesis